MYIDQKYLFETPPKVLYIMLWSDDFQTLVLCQSDHSTWLLTITICPPKHSRALPQYTYPVTLGIKGQNHKKVIEKVLDEVRMGVAMLLAIKEMDLNAG
eukprot:10577203-Ditylum_brightwellii.AAC.1